MAIKKEAFGSASKFVSDLCTSKANAGYTSYYLLSVTSMGHSVRIAITNNDLMV